MRRVLPLVLACVLGIVACSEGDLVLQIDLQSFVTDSGTLPDPSAGYATLVLPVPVELRGLEVLAPSSVGLVEAIDELTEIRTVQLSYTLQTVHRRGEGETTLRLRLAGLREDLARTDAVFDSIAIDLEPMNDRSIERTVDLPARFVELFEGTEIWLSADADVRTRAAATVGDSLSGHLWLRDMRARVVATRDFF